MSRGIIAKLGIPAIAFATVALLAPEPAGAQWPPPDVPGIDLSDPQYWPNEQDYTNRWNYWSWIHPEALARVQGYSPYEVALGSGIHVDRAWQKTIGDRRVIIAVLDSGIRWHERDLANQYYLNEGELPPPDAGCTGDGTTYDVNGDGLFNIQDYTTNTGTEQPASPCDTRILSHPGGWDINNNGFLDPQDLIAIFSDGVDDDGNGYIDDISGWDFYQDDNDAYDDTEFGHGTGEARWSAAEGNNGIGTVGVCPNCQVMMLRVGESFIVDANDFALATIYGVDNGVSLIQEALGSLNNTKLSQDAIDYAWANDVTVVASAADEDSFHHNFPGTNNHTIYVHAIQHDSASFKQAKTYLNYCNCTNYGANLALSTSGTSCSSEATGRTAGAVGLLYSMALREDLPFPGGTPGPTDKRGARRLRADEVRQLLTMTADDIHDPAAANDPERYPTRVGWEQRFGYGRTNIGAAVRQVEAGRIPPVVDIVSPWWFAPLYPEQTPRVEIRGEISFRSLYDSIDYVVEWAPGIEPDDADFTTIAAGTGRTAPLLGVLATWDISGLTVNNPPQPPPDGVVNRYMVTLRIRVTTRSATPELDGVRAERRRAVNVLRDPDLLPGFPVFIGASGEGSPKTADLDGDGIREIVYPDADGWVHVVRGDGTYLPGWPAPVNRLPHLDPANPEHHLGAPAFQTGAVEAEVRSSITSAPAVADLTGDGEPEVVVATLDGWVYVFDAAGNEAPGFPVGVDPALAVNPSRHNNVDTGIFAAPVVEDLDGDGNYEIIVSAYDGHVYVWHHDGRPAQGFPVKLYDGTGDMARSLSSPAVGDVDGDGRPDILLGSNKTESEMGYFWAVHADGNSHPQGPFLAGFPIKILSINTLPLVGEGIFTSPALADVDGDGRLEIVVSGNVGPPKIFDGRGDLLRAMENGVPGDPQRGYGPGSDSTDMPLQVIFTNPVIADFNNDGRLNLLQGAGGLLVAAAFASGGTRIDFEHMLGAWDIGSKRFLYAYPRQVDDWQFFMSPAVADIDGDGLPEAITGSAGYYLRAFDHLGREPAGWPKFTGGWIITAPAVGDVTGDGFLDVVAGTRNGWLFAWRTTGPVTGRVEWESYKHDNRNTGNYHTPLEQGTRELPRNDDIDGDGVPNTEDCDIDGDGDWNQFDDDIDGDGVPNDWDYDDDGDGIPDELDDTPQGPVCQPKEPKETGCGCGTAGPLGGPGLPLLPVLLVPWLLLRRARTRVRGARLSAPLLAMVVLLAMAGCESTDTEVPYTNAELLAQGPYPVGYLTLTLVDDSRPTWSSPDASDLPSRTLVTEVFYPAAEAGRDAAPAAGPHPLLVYAHGLMGDRLNNSQLASLLASHGLVVAAPDFPRTRMGTPGGVVFEDVRFQPGDVGFVIDEILGGGGGAGGALAAELDGRVLLIGYSLGAFTATLAGFHPEERHPSVDAVVLMAPSACFVPDNTFADQTLPLLILHGDRDAIIPYENGPEAIFQAASGPRWLLTLAEGTHTGFVDALADLLDGLTHADSVGCDAISGTVPTDPAEVREEYTSWLLGLGGLPMISGCTPACSNPDLLTTSMRPTRQVEILAVAVRAFVSCVVDSDAKACRFLDEHMEAQNPDVSMRGQ